MRMFVGAPDERGSKAAVWRWVDRDVVRRVTEGS